MRPGSPHPPADGRIGSSRRAYEKEVTAHKETNELFIAVRVAVFVLLALLIGRRSLVVVCAEVGVCPDTPRMSASAQSPISVYTLLTAIGAPIRWANLGRRPRRRAGNPCRAGGPGRPASRP